MLLVSKQYMILTEFKLICSIYATIIITRVLFFCIPRLLTVAGYFVGFVRY